MYTKGVRFDFYASNEKHPHEKGSTVKYRWIYLVALSVLPYFLSTPLGAQQEQQPVSDKITITIDQLEKMSSEEIAAMCEKEGIDMRDINDLLLAGGNIETRLPGGIQPRTQPPKPSFADLVKKEREELQYPDGYLDYQAAVDVGEEALTIPEPESALSEVTNKTEAFLNKYVRGKSKQALLFVAFILYRQATYIFSQLLSDRRLVEHGDPLRGKDHQQIKSTVEKHEQSMRNSFVSPLHKVSSTGRLEMRQQPLVSMLSILGLNSRVAEASDLFVRFAYAGSRFWMDMSDHIYMLRKNPLHCLSQPHIYFRGIIDTWHRARSLFSDPLYLGTEISLMTRVLVGVSLPFAWCTTFARYSPGNPMGNPMFRTVMQASALTITNDLGRTTDNWFEREFTLEQRDNLFKMSGGIVRERLFTDLGHMAYNYISHAHISPQSNKSSAQQGFGHYMGRQSGKYVIRHLYLAAVISLVKVICRNGGVKGVKWCMRRAGDALTKLGFFSRNPIDQSQDKLKDLCVGQGWMSKSENLDEWSAEKLSIAFPGALVRAVQKVAGKAEITRLEAETPGIVHHLTTMNGLSFFDLMQQFSVNPMIFMMIMESVNVVRRALSPKMWKEVLEMVPVEIFVDQFLNRQRLACQFITESFVGWLSKPVLKKLNRMVLPHSKA